jgi:hypothetical protein
MLSNQDPTPLLRIYGDGKVLAHFPVYMKKAGDYQLTLSQSELLTLVRSLAQDGIFDFDGKASQRYKQQKDSQKAFSTGTLQHVSDTTKTVIDINLNSYQRSFADKRITNFSKTFIWDNLQQDAKRYTQSTAITRAAASARNLHLLLDRAGNTIAK